MESFLPDFVVLYFVSDRALPKGGRLLPEQEILDVLPSARTADGGAGPGVLRLPADRGQLQVRAQRVARNHGAGHHVPAALQEAHGRGQTQLARPPVVKFIF